MTENSDSGALDQAPVPTAPVHAMLLMLTGLMAAIHLLQTLAMAGWVTPYFLPNSVYGLLGFFGASFDAALAGEPYSIQLWWSFLTHALVHGSWLHLLMNCGIFLAIGHMIVRTVGIGTLLTVFLVSVIGGALAHGLIAGHQGVLIGASGGVFGQLGAVVVWRAAMLMRGGFSLKPIWRLLLGLIAMNAVLALALSGGFGGGESSGTELAWEAHLGGFLAGSLIALFRQPPSTEMSRRPRAQRTIL
ncbi:MAG: rhomboid family intramembrane serine protease [Pseudomonadota bacterium]